MLKTYKVQYKERYVRYGFAWVDADSKAEAKRIVREESHLDYDMEYDRGEIEPDWRRPITCQKAEIWEGK